MRTRRVQPKLGRPVGARVRRLRSLRERTVRDAQVVHEETRALTATLAAQGLTMRDIGGLLGVSYQRVQQIIKGE